MVLILTHLDTGDCTAYALLYVLFQQFTTVNLWKLQFSPNHYLGNSPCKVLFSNKCIWTYWYFNAVYYRIWAAMQE